MHNYVATAAANTTRHCRREQPENDEKSTHSLKNIQQRWSIESFKYKIQYEFDPNADLIKLKTHNSVRFK